MTINYPKIIFVNFIMSILAYIFFYNDNMTTIVGWILIGFVSSLFFKENLPGHFLKSMFINLLFFFILSLLIAYLGWATIDFVGKGSSESLFFISRYNNLSFGSEIFYSYGYFAGIIPQGIYERLRKKETGNL